MRLHEQFSSFLSDEDGAVTVDWVVLTAAIVGLGIAVLTAVSFQIGEVTSSVDGDLAAVPDDVSVIKENILGAN